MAVLLDAIQATTLAAAAVLAGGQVYIARNVVHAIGNTSQELGVRMHQELLTWRNGRVMRPAGMTAILVLTAAFAVIPFADVRTAATEVLTGCAYAAIWGYMLLARRERPFNKEINSWGTGPVPETYPELRADWDAQQHRRLALTCLTFAFTIAAVMVNT